MIHYPSSLISYLVVIIKEQVVQLLLFHLIPLCQIRYFMNVIHTNALGEFRFEVHIHKFVFNLVTSIFFIKSS